MTSNCFCCLCFMIQLSWLFPLKTVVFGLSSRVDQVGKDEKWENIKSAGTDSQLSVGNFLG